MTPEAFAILVSAAESPTIAVSFGSSFDEDVLELQTDSITLAAEDPRLADLAGTEDGAYLWAGQKHSGGSLSLGPIVIQGDAGSLVVFDIRRVAAVALQHEQG